MNFPLVTTDWLADNLSRKNLVLLDASMVNVIGREPIVYDLPVFIPGARKFDLEGNFCDLNATMVHAFPGEEQFTREARKLGINADSLVVVYDNQGVYSAPRAWWMFQSMGHENTFVLDGGLPKWLAEERETASSVAQESAKSGNIRATFHSGKVCDSSYVLKALEAGQATAVDARSAERFYGMAPEPREGVRSGHIPGSQNLPFAQVLDEHSFKSVEQLKAVFASTLPSDSEQAVFSCGSGITACIILMAAVIAGYEHNVLYDGSWADWGSNPSLPVATSA
ncbi:MAG: sulfurtransferase [Marinobacter sp.]|uniref:sulfurtransferase n=1 Tax=Marinobacter sp. TaxID=50741 RepID=UPI001B64DF47|nr:sulfurtransferase [Marinobacter sp.]MBQ0746810.1 sulfurtransferase [Marinobacter sp.]MBQ0815802.1 sulfurtransferase [Marinobacter sp.]|tara:strand:+ start:4326 stop:5171 length:846 start_codon:yes stop_codon:yes gene_type:complete